MTTIVGARAAAKARLQASGSGITPELRFKGDQQEPLPDTPAPFAFVVFDNQGSGGGPTAFGGGRGNNLYRNRASLEIWTFSPNDEGEDVVLAHAETIAAWLRSFRDSDISCFSADVIPVGAGAGVSPPGMDSDVSNYQVALVEVTLHFDQIG